MRWNQPEFLSKPIEIEELPPVNPSIAEFIELLDMMNRAVGRPEAEAVIKDASSWNRRYYEGNPCFTFFRHIPDPKQN